MNRRRRAAAEPVSAAVPGAVLFGRSFSAAEIAGTALAAAAEVRMSRSVE